jgi:hypothetical protein
MAMRSRSPDGVTGEHRLSTGAIPVQSAAWDPKIGVQHARGDSEPAGSVRVTATSYGSAAATKRFSVHEIDSDRFFR